MKVKVIFKSVKNLKIIEFMMDPSGIIFTSHKYKMCIAGIIKIYHLFANVMD